MERPIHLPPLALHQFVADRGRGDVEAPATFMVEWTSAEPVNEPIVEALMVSSHASRGLSFRSLGRALDMPETSEISNHPHQSIE